MFFLSQFLRHRQMFLDVTGYQTDCYVADMSRIDRKECWVENRSTQIYESLMNDEVVWSEGRSYSMDSVVESVVCSDRFRALAIESLTHPEDAGYDLRNLISAAGETLADQLAAAELKEMGI